MLDEIIISWVDRGQGVGGTRWQLIVKFPMQARKLKKKIIKKKVTDSVINGSQNKRLNE